MSDKEYFVTKLTFREDKKLIDNVFVRESNDNKLLEGEIQTREWMVNRINEGSKISVIKPIADKKNIWQKSNPFVYEEGYFKWGINLPRNSTKRKTFISYYHGDNQDDKIKFENLFGDLIISKSVENGDIDSDNSPDYVKQLIQSDYLRDTTVLVVLVGEKTKCRKHVDWEISGAISSRVGGNSGLIGILLPSHPDFGEGKKRYKKNFPERLVDNISSGYAKLYDWTEDRALMQGYIEAAFENKSNTDKIKNSRPQMLEDICE